LERRNPRGASGKGRVYVGRVEYPIQYKKTPSCQSQGQLIKGRGSGPFFQGNGRKIESKVLKERSLSSPREQSGKKKIPFVLTEGGGTIGADEEKKEGGEKKYKFKH